MISRHVKIIIGGAKIKMADSNRCDNPIFKLHFLIHIDVLMLCRKFELKFLSHDHFFNEPSCCKYPVTDIYKSTPFSAKYISKYIQYKGLGILRY